MNDANAMDVRQSTANWLCRNTIMFEKRRRPVRAIYTKWSLGCQGSATFLRYLSNLVCIRNCIYKSAHCRLPSKSPRRYQFQSHYSRSGHGYSRTVDMATVVGVIKSRSRLSLFRPLLLVSGSSPSSRAARLRREHAIGAKQSYLLRVLAGGVVFILSLLFPGVVVESSFVIIPSGAVTNAAKPVENVSKQVW